MASMFSFGMACVVLFGGFQPAKQARELTFEKLNFVNLSCSAFQAISARMLMRSSSVRSAPVNWSASGSALEDS